MEEIKMALRTFNEARDWEQYHTPENLAKSIAIRGGMSCWNVFNGTTVTTCRPSAMRSLT